MGFEGRRLFRRQRPLDILAEELDAFGAVLEGEGHFGVTLSDTPRKMHFVRGRFGAFHPPKNSPSFSRNASRARCSRLFTAGTVKSSAEAISSFDNPSTSLRRNTVR